MGAFSRVKSRIQCAGCGWAGEVEIQFKYGSLYDYDYSIGSRIVWGSPQVGEPGERRVAVDGIAECLRCNSEIPFDVLIESGVIRSVQPRSGEHDYHHGEGEYVILED